MTPEETSTLTAWLRSNERAIALDIPDLVDWMLATGCRIGEALAVRHATNTEGKPLLDIDANTWEVNDGIVFAAPSAHTLRDPSNASGDLRQLLDSFDCNVCARTGYQLKPDGSFELGPKGQRLRCAEGPGRG